MAILDAMKSLLQCILADGSQHSHVILQENDPAAKLKKLTLSELSGGILVIGPDQGRVINDKSGKKVAECLSPLFCVSSTHDHNRACDAVLVRLAADGKVEIFYIDLKSDSPSGYVSQFQSTRCFMHYACHILRDLYNESADIGRERFVIFHTDSSGMRRGFNKTKTQFHSTTSGNTAQTPYKRIVANDDTIRCTEIF
jgi:hypothetical protein